MAEALKYIIVADLKNPRMKQGWEELQPILAAQPDLQCVASDLGNGLNSAGLVADLVLVLGGDGAILRACRQMGMNQIPILGVNLGRLGFLADVSPQEFQDFLPQILQRQYHITRCLMYECRLTRASGAPETFLGLNEVAISSGASLGMIDITLSINGERVTTYSGDGLIVSTPVGSTAHSLSAGGPILRQDLAAFVITPICPHTLTNRPLVDSSEAIYELTVPKAPPGTTLVIDGQIKLPVQSGDRIEVRQAPVRFQLAKLPCNNYYATLHRKLGWGGQPNYGT
jgi:NAD+ kinase